MKIEDIIKCLAAMSPQTPDVAVVPPIELVEFRRRGVSMLVGVMDASLPGIPDWKVAIISLTPKLSDPGASKRRTILVDRRLVEPRHG